MTWSWIENSSRTSEWGRTLLTSETLMLQQELLSIEQRFEALKSKANGRGVITKTVTVKN